MYFKSFMNFVSISMRESKSKHHIMTVLETISMFSEFYLFFLFPFYHFFPSTMPIQPFNMFLHAMKFAEFGVYLFKHVLNGSLSRHCELKAKLRSHTLLYLQEMMIIIHCSNKVVTLYNAHIYRYNDMIRLQWGFVCVSVCGWNYVMISNTFT